MQTQASNQPDLRLGIVVTVTTAILFYGAIGLLVWRLI